MRLREVLLVACLAACGSADLRGATSFAAGRIPIGEPRGQFVPRECRDGRAQAVPVPAAEIRLIELADGRELLFESRQGYDSLVVTNRFDRDGSRVFQFIAESADGPELLHERSFATSLGGAGNLLVADRFETKRLDSGFRASAERVVLRCALIPVRVQLDRLPRLE